MTGTAARVRIAATAARARIGGAAGVAGMVMVVLALAGACSSTGSDGAVGAAGAGGAGTADSKASAEKGAAGLTAGGLTAGGLTADGLTADGAPAAAGGGTPNQPGATDLPPLGRPAPNGRELVRTAEVTIRAKDVDDAARRAGDAAGALGGFVFDERTALAVTPDGRPTASLTLKVPPERFAELLDRLRQLGTQFERRIAVEDVTEQVADVSSRLASQRESVARLRALLAQAKNVGEVVTVEAELQRRESDLESLEGRERALSAQVDLATVRLTLVPPETVTPGGREHRGFLAGLRSGWHAFAGVALATATALGASLPFVLLLAVLAPAAYAVRAWMRRRRRTSVVAPAG